MITTADAMEVMLIVQACHHRTAPRMDDPEVARATAIIWSELFNQHHLQIPDLIAAVKQRAALHADAPEPADVIRVARDIRRERSERERDRDDVARQKAIDRKSAVDVDVITGVMPFGPVKNDTERLKAARAALENCQGRADAVPAIREYFAAKREAQRAAS